MARTVIFNVDGTIANLNHRLFFVKDPKFLIGGKVDWDSFFLNAEDDIPILKTVEILHMYQHNGYRVELWTGRSSEVSGVNTRDMLVDWLDKYQIFPQAIRMRSPGDYTEDAKLKRSWLRSWSLDNEQLPHCVYEDRASVCDMWRDEGIQCYQVAKGEF